MTGADQPGSLIDLLVDATRDTLQSVFRAEPIGAVVIDDAASREITLHNDLVARNPDDAVSRELALHNDLAEAAPIDANSRELTLHNDSTQYAPDDASSREFVIHNDLVELTPSDVNSREITLHNEAEDLLAFSDAISREISVANDPNTVVLGDAVSREISIENDPPGATDIIDAVSREMSLINDPLQVIATDAVSRELSLFKPSADLQVAVVAVAPTSGAFTGYPATVTWTIVNAGPAPTERAWIDRLFASRNAIYGDSDDILVGDVPYTAGRLDPGASLARSQPIGLPGTPGDYYYIVVTDFRGDIVEEPAEDNNWRASESALRVEWAPEPDLTVTEVEPVALAGDGARISVTVTVCNAGGRAANPDWADRVYLVRDGQTFDPARDRENYIGQAVRTTPLAAGASYSRIIPATIPPGLSGDFRLVVFTDATGLLPEPRAEDNNVFVAPGVTQVIQTELPDLRISEITPGSERYSGLPYTFLYRVANDGPGTANGYWVDRVYLSADDVLDVATDTLINEQGGTRLFAPLSNYTRTVTFTLPAQAGNYWLFAVTDAGGQISEVDEANNRRPLPLAVQAPDYAARVTAAVETALVGAAVELTGEAFFLDGGAPAANVDVEVRVLVRGTRRILRVRTDEDGRFTTTFRPLPTEAGHYRVAADHPAVAADTVQDEFTLYGMTASPTGVSRALTVGDPDFVGSIQLRNLGNTPLTGLSATIESLPASILLAVEAPPALGPDEVVNLAYLLRATDSTPPVASPRIRFATAVGAAATVDFGLAVRDPQPRIIAEPSRLDAVMVRGQRSFVQFRVRNVGGAPSGPLTVSLPPGAPWLAVTSDQPIASLLPGEQAEVVLDLSPDESVPLNAPISSAIVARMSSGQGVSVPFTFTAISERRSALRVVATDEFTYWAPGEPRVEDANVVVRRVRDGVVVGEEVTGGDGEVLLQDLTEAYYEVVVTAPDHGTARTTILAGADQETLVTAFLPRQLVRYTWTVVPTTVPDRYEVTIRTVFETRAPAPVITVEPSLIDLREFEGQSRQVIFRITNHGQIAARNVRFYVGDHPRWQQTPLVTDLGDLPGHIAGETPNSFEVPVTITDLGSDGDPDCTAVVGGYQWQLLCGTLRDYAQPVTYQLPPHACGGGGPGGGSPPPPSGGGGGIPLPPPITWQPTTVRVDCDPCVVRCATAILDCALGYVIPDLVSCVLDTVTSDCPDEWSADWQTTKCLIDFIRSCIVDVPGFGEFECLCDIYFSCNRDYCPEDGGLEPPSCDPIDILTGDIEPDDGPPSSGDPLLDYYRDTFDRAVAFLRVPVEIFGHPRWVLVREQDRPLLVEFLNEFVNRIGVSSETGAYISVQERQELLVASRPEGITEVDLNQFLDRWNRTGEYWSAGIFARRQVPSGQSTDFIDRERLQELWDRAREAISADRTQGFTRLLESLRYALDVLREDRLTQKKGICARVRIRIDQQAVISRNAFRATLELENDGDEPLEDVAVEVIITDDAGAAAGDRFSLVLDQLTGLPDVTGGGDVVGGGAATASWLIRPYDEAAPTGPRVYNVSGRLSYRLGGEQVTIPLFPVAINVLPNPNLRFKYFLEMRVYGDDPFTREVVEPAVPFSLGLMVTNTGAGVAHDLQITSAQPVIEDDDGLAIRMQIIGTQLGTRAISPSLLVNFGNIDAGETDVARWLLTSTIQGEFVEYSAEIRHIDGLGDPRLSLIDPPEIFAMTHVVRVDRDAAGAPHDDGKPDFLTHEEFPNIEDIPDRIHVSDGTVLPIRRAADATGEGLPSLTEPRARVTANVTAPGWFYIRVDDPAEGRFAITRVIRSDGRVVRLEDNVWRTRRVIRLAGQPERPERLVHLVDFLPAAGGVSYEVEYGLLRGDADCDGIVTLNDIDPFVAALVGRSGYEARYPGCAWLTADANRDGRVDFDDISAFVECIVRGACR